MKRNIFSLLPTFVFATFVSAMAFSLVSCNPESDVAPEVSVPEGYENYFIEDLSFSCSAGEVKVAFQINVDWSMEVVGSSSWLSVEPASGSAGLHKVLVRVTANDTDEPRSAKIHLRCGTAKVAEIAVVQEANHEAVDLGLSVKWACCNVGADVPEGYGGYYAWGETEEKSNYTWENYKYYNSSTGEFDNIGSNISGTSYDVAHVKWGGSWRMPTLSEIQELCNKCSCQWTTVNGVSGQKVTGPNGNSIFLPAAGYRYGTVVLDRGSYGYYWSGTLSEYLSGSACSLGFYCGFWGWNGYSRGDGHAVRPVTE